MVRLGAADDHANADGQTVLDFFQAQDKALVEARTIPKPALTLNDAAEHYLAWYREHRKAIRETESAVAAHILPTLGERPVSQLTAKDLKAWRDRLARTPARKRTGFGKQPQFCEKPATDEEVRARQATANRILAVLKAILNKAFEDELVADDTAWRQVKPFRKVDKPRIRFLTEAESIRLVNSCARELRPLLTAALFTGARYGELVRMKVADFDPKSALVFIAPSKSGAPRYVPLNNAALDFFKLHTAGRSGTELLFARANGSPWGKNHDKRPLRAANTEARISPPVRFHELRHTYASLLAQAGGDLLTISKLLGHADTRITARHYAHLCDRTLANAVNAMLPNFGHKPKSNVRMLR
jgi:integrase